LKAYRAYIAGLGTTGVLIGSFLLLLAVVSTIVAFRGAPGEASNEGLGRLDVSDSRQVSQPTGAPGSEAGRGRPARDRGTAGRGSKRRGSATGRIGGGAGAVRGERVAGGFAGVAAEGTGPSQAAGGESGKGDGAGGRSRLPVDPRHVGSPPAAPTVGDVATGLGDAVEQTGSGLGETVGTAAPPLEAPVVQTGESAAGVLRDAAPVVDQTVDDVTGVADQVTGGVGVGGGN
jgi:hypothetical protein